MKHMPKKDKIVVKKWSFGGKMQVLYLKIDKTRDVKS